MGDWGIGKFVTFVLIFVIALIASAQQISKLTSSFGTPSRLDNKPDDKVEETPRTYPEIEEQLTSATKRYVAKYYPAISEGDTFVIQLTSLVDEKYMNSVRDVKNGNTKCDGYTVVYNDQKVVNYTSYIKCGDNYETAGYSIRLQEKY